MEIVGAVAEGEDEFPLFVVALVRPTHPVQSNEKMKIMQKLQRLVPRTSTFLEDLGHNEFIGVTRRQRRFQGGLHSLALVRPRFIQRYSPDRPSPTGRKVK